MLAPDLLAALVGRVRILPTVPDKVRGEWTIVVDVGLPVGDRTDGKNLAHLESRIRREHACHQVELLRLIARWLGVRRLIRGLARKDHAEVIGLHLAIRGSRISRWSLRH